MEDSITVKISNFSDLMRWLTVFEWVVLLVWLAFLITYFNLGSLIAFLVFLVAFVIHFIVLERVPTVVTVNSECLQYKRVFGGRKIMLTEIKSLSCEQYEVRGRYNISQCIKLIIVTVNGDDYELHDFVDTRTMVSDIIENKQTDVPIVQLYNFLKAKIATDG